MSSKKAKSSSASPSGVQEISQAFSEMLISNVRNHLISTVVAFIDKAASSKLSTKEDYVNIWNTVAPEHTINLQTTFKKKTEPTTVSGKICCFYYVRSKKACNEEVSVKSSSGKYCSRHLKEETKEPKEPVVDGLKKKCEYTNSKGENQGKICESNVSAKSTTGKYCSKHAKIAEKPEASTKKIGKKSSKDEATSDINNFKPRLNQKLKVYVDTATGFVIQKENKKIYARVRDGDLTSLTDDDITLIKKQNFEYDETLFPQLHPELVGNESNEEDESEDSEPDDVSSSEEDEDEDENNES